MAPSLARWAWAPRAGLPRRLPAPVPTGQQPQSSPPVTVSWPKPIVPPPDARLPILRGSAGPTQGNPAGVVTASVEGRERGAGTASGSAAEEWTGEAGGAAGWTPIRAVVMFPGHPSKWSPRSHERGGPRPVIRSDFEYIGTAEPNHHVGAHCLGGCHV